MAISPKTSGLPHPTHQALIHSEAHIGPCYQGIPRDKSNTVSAPKTWSGGGVRAETVRWLQGWVQEVRWPVPHRLTVAAGGARVKSVVGVMMPPWLAWWIGRKCTTHNAPKCVGSLGLRVDIGKPEAPPTIVSNGAIESAQSSPWASDLFREVILTQKQVFNYLSWKSTR